MGKGPIKRRALVITGLGIGSWVLGAFLFWGANTLTKDFSEDNGPIVAIIAPVLENQ